MEKRKCIITANEEKWKTNVTDTVILSKTFNININHILFTNIKIKRKIIIRSNKMKFIYSVCKFPYFLAVGLFSTHVWCWGITQRCAHTAFYKHWFLAGKCGRYLDFQICCKTINYHQNMVYRGSVRQTNTYSLQ